MQMEIELAYINLINIHRRDWIHLQLKNRQKKWKIQISMKNRDYLWVSKDLRIESSGEGADRLSSVVGTEWDWVLKLFFYGKENLNKKYK